MQRVPHGLATAIVLLTAVSTGVEAAVDERSGTCAQVDRTPSVGILVVDYERIPRHLWVQAEKAVTLVYHSISVDTTWLRVHPEAKAPPASPTPNSSGLWLTVLIPSPLMTSARQRNATNVLGFAPYSVDKRGQLAYVFYDRIVTFARRTGANPARALAYAIAHEVGHLLLPVRAHTDVGVMRAEMDWRTIGPTLDGPEFFSPEQRDLIRGSVACEQEVVE